MTSGAAQAVEWDASLPGAGAQRATAIAQLYVRMAHYSPLTILVIDALCFAFARDGATVRELADYLGLAEDRVAAALDAVPADMRCTSRDLDALASSDNNNDEDDDNVDNNDVANTRATTTTRSNGEGARRSRAEDEAVRHYLNYKRLLPLVYAHVTRMLLALCVVPLPLCAYTEGVRRSRLGSLAAASTLRPRREADNNNNNNSNNGDDDVSANISYALRQREALDGVYCGVCRSYTALSEYATTLSRCPVCGADVLRSTLERIRDAYAARTARGESLVTLLPTATATATAAAAATAARRVASNTTAVSSGGNDAVSSPSPSYAATGSRTVADRDAPELDSALARDPFVVQQALAFLYVYSTPFAYVNESAYIVHAEDILTDAEHERRLHGTASLAFQFRAAHRNAAAAVHVRVVTQRDVDAAKRRDNARKLAKRAHLPPWLRHYTTRAYREATAPRSRNNSNSSSGVDGDDAMPTRLAAHVTESGSSDDSRRGVATAAAAADARVRAKGQRNAHAPATVASTREQLTHAARFIVREVYEDDYDDVPLPRRDRTRHDAHTR